MLFSFYNYNSYILQVSYTLFSQVPVSFICEKSKFNNNRFGDKKILDIDQIKITSTDLIF